MHALLRLSDRLAALCRGIGRVGAWLIVPLVLVISFDVLTRKMGFVQMWIQGSWLHDYLAPTRLQELEWHLHAVVFLLAYAMAYLDGSHVRVDVWREHRGERARGWIELVGLLLLAIPFCVVLVFHSWEFVATAWLQNEGSASTTGLPHRWVVKSFLLSGTALLLCALLATLLRLLVFLFGDAAASRAAERRLGVANITEPAGDTG